MLTILQAPMMPPRQFRVISSAFSPSGALSSYIPLVALCRLALVNTCSTPPPPPDGDIALPVCASCPPFCVSCAVYDYFVRGQTLVERESALPDEHDPKATSAAINLASELKVQVKQWLGARA